MNNKGWEDAYAPRSAVTKYAIRVSILNLMTGKLNFLGYLVPGTVGCRQSVNETNTFSSVTAAVAAIVKLLRDNAHISRHDQYEIVGVEMTTTIREIPLNVGVEMTTTIREIPLKTL